MATKLTYSILELSIIIVFSIFVGIFFMCSVCELPFDTDVPEAVYYDYCSMGCGDLDMEHLHTRYMDSGDDECYCKRDNESIRIW
ncbi:MAG: hypothetical protein KAS32_31445 [Candidatus Peribacteraceae bacterium]|nr:hypothetical protein [Candidatus Peribacteraceae bacterium]